MRIALVELKSADYLNIYAIINMPRGTPLLAAILEQHGHDVTCYVETVESFRWQDLMDYDLIGFSIISCTAKPTYSMIKRLRKAGYRRTIVVGGPHATAQPEESLNVGANFVVRHEGDITFPELVKAVDEFKFLDDVPGISWKVRRDETRNNPDRAFLTEAELSELPMPAFRTIVGYKKMRQISLTCSRGCQYACYFCAVRGMFGPQYRFTTCDWRMAQLKAFRDQYPELWQSCVIFFADDNFFGTPRGKQITIEMLKRMISEELIPPKGWLCQMRVTDATPELVKLMKKAGCNTVCLGIESADADTLKALKKGQTPEQIRIGLENLYRAGIETLAMTIAGADNGNFWSFFREIRTLTKWHITYLQVVAMVPLPDTPMTDQLISDGRKFSKNYDRYNGMHVLIKPKRMSRFGVFMSLYFVSIWFYFLTGHGRRLFNRHFRQYWKMIGITLRQSLKWPWQTIKERFISH